MVLYSKRKAIFLVTTETFDCQRCCMRRQCNFLTYLYLEYGVVDYVSIFLCIKVFWLIQNNNLIIWRFTSSFNVSLLCLLTTTTSIGSGQYFSVSASATWTTNFTYTSNYFENIIELQLLNQWALGKTYLILLSNAILLHVGCFPPSAAFSGNMSENYGTLKLIPLEVVFRLWQKILL